MLVISFIHYFLLSFRNAQLLLTSQIKYSQDDAARRGGGDRTAAQLQQALDYSASLYRLYEQQLSILRAKLDFGIAEATALEQQTDPFGYENYDDDTRQFLQGRQVEAEQQLTKARARHAAERSARANSGGFGSSVGGAHRSSVGGLSGGAGRGAGRGNNSGRGSSSRGRGNHSGRGSGGRG